MIEILHHKEDIVWFKPHGRGGLQYWAYSKHNEQRVEFYHGRILKKILVLTGIGWQNRIDKLKV